jgi:chromosome condensin MukBEF MukE localization factor
MSSFLNENAKSSDFVQLDGRAFYLDFTNKLRYFYDHLLLSLCKVPDESFIIRNRNKKGSGIITRTNELLFINPRTFSGTSRKVLVL